MKLLQLNPLFVLCLFVLGINTTTYAQRSRERKADKEFSNNAYIDAIKVYERIANKGYINTSILTNLGDSYYFNGKLDEAYKWYNQLFTSTYEDKNINQIPSEYYYRYAQSLKAVNKYDEAKEVLSKFATLEQNDSRARIFEKTKESYLEDIKNRSNQYDIKMLAINSNYSDYGATVYNDHLIFTSARATEKGNVKIHEWTNESFTSIYKAKINEDWTLEEPKLFAESLTTKRVNEASPVFTKDGKTVYFTKNNSTVNGKGVFNSTSNSRLKIYKATLKENGVWSNIIELPFNGDNFSTAHPALTPDEKWLYFVSDREGTYGSSDLFRVEIMANDTYGTVENLGSRINTEGKETFPFISDNNILYFSTDGRPGLGGLDVYMTELYQDGTFGEVVNMGSPINSSLDDFSFYINEKKGKGFVSSNRQGSKGGDDIYYIEEKPCVFVVNGIVVDSDESSKVTLAKAKLTLFDGQYKELRQFETDKNGQFKLFDLDCETKYRIKVDYDKYISKEAIVTAEETKGGKVITIKVDKELIPVALQDDLFKKLKMKPIYFDFDKADIRSDAAIELMKVVEVLKEVEGMKIDIRSHTDARGKDAYNMKLSQRRAEATAKWIISQGIDANRVSFIGMGSTTPIVKCPTLNSCTDAQHQENRRSEFIIKDM
ncbi:MAG: OmpA family protein [Flavobacteriaceae bacterium]|jgi:outer membrane protein OmpA-like peptidoglycan-associated protein/tetratricopeptide (TPR) repeat protein|nr:OmpA family protein [Flavobacteriaceae bacterium]